MTSTTKKAQFKGSLEALLDELAPEKSAEAHTEAGGYQGATTHPTKDVDDRTDEASEGARSKENTEDNKSEPNRGKTVDETTPGPGAGQQSVQTDIGITSKATGEDPSAETEGTKTTKHDDGYKAPSSHPARTDNSELDGHKYASLEEEFFAFAKQAEDIGSQLLAEITSQAVTPAQKAAGGDEGNGKADPKGAGNPNSQAGGVGVQDGPITTDGKVNAKDENGANPAGKEAQAQPAAKAAEAAGYDLAGLFANLDIPVEDKQAADAFVIDQLQTVLTLAQQRAVKAAQFLHAHFKAAGEEGGEGGESEESEESEEGGPPAGGGGGGAPPAAGGGDAELMAMLGGGGGGGAPPPEAGGGGEVPGADSALAGMGGDGGGMGGGDDGGLAALEAALMQLGITPEQLMEALQGGGGGAGGAMGGDMGGGAPPPEAAMAGAGAGGMPPKLGAAKPAAKPAAKQAGHKQASPAMQAVIRELAQRSRS